MNWLDRIAQHQEEWLRYVHSFGQCEYAEDIVQEMYIRLDKFSSPDKVLKPNGSVNKTYIWFVLRNLFVDYHKQCNKIHKEQIDNLHIYQELQEDGFEEAFDEMTYRINKEIKSWHWYDQQMFKTYVYSDMSYRDLAKDLDKGGTGISLSSIYNTIKNCKDRLTDAVGEDWQDLINGDYDKL